MTGRIREWRIDRGWSQADLATAIDVTPATVFRWEAGRSRPKPANLLAFADALGIAVDDIELSHAVVAPVRPRRSYEVWQARLHQALRARNR
jgi:transcriptional regulator with XRE-family HTH domain